MITNFGRPVSICNAAVMLHDNVDIRWVCRISVVGYLSGQASACCPVLVSPSLLSNTDYYSEVTPARTGSWSKSSRSELRSGPGVECTSHLEVSCPFFRTIPESYRNEILRLGTMQNRACYMVDTRFWSDASSQPMSRGPVVNGAKPDIRAVICPVFWISAGLCVRKTLRKDCGYSGRTCRVLI